MTKLGVLRSQTHPVKVQREFERVALFEEIVLSHRRLHLCHRINHITPRFLLVVGAARHQRLVDEPELDARVELHLAEEPADLALARLQIRGVSHLRIEAILAVRDGQVRNV